MTIDFPPKWKVLLDILKEIKADYQQKRTEVENDLTNDRENVIVLDADPNNSSLATADSTKSVSIPAHVTQICKLGFTGRVLLVVRDELALSQLRDVMIHGTEYVMDTRFRWFVSQQCADIRRRYRKSHGSSATTTIRAKGKGSTNTSTDPLDPVQNVVEIDMTDSAVQQLLQEDQTTASNSNTENNGFFGMGLEEQAMKQLSVESQLMLIQAIFFLFSLFHVD